MVERYAVTLGCPCCASSCAPVADAARVSNQIAPNMAVQRIVACTNCGAEFMLTVELAPLRMTKTNPHMTAPKPRRAPSGRSRYEDARINA